jgi:hypothetical protein
MIELEEIYVSDTNIEVSGYLIKDDNEIGFEWILNIIRDYNHDDWCEGWDVDFDESDMLIYVDGKFRHVDHLIPEESYIRVISIITDKLINN